MLLALHIPDGFMSLPLALLGWLLAVPALAWALSHCRDVEERETSLAALLAAFLFAAQTFHFPVPGGTTGHLVGATLVVILNGPALGLLIVSSVVILQAIAFGDGGLLTLGWNLTNMGLLAGLVGGSVFSWLRKSKVPPFPAAFTAAWLATLLAALGTALELALAGLTPLALSLPTVLGVQAVVGLGEGLVTAAALTFLLQARPNVVREDRSMVWPGASVLALLGSATLLPPSTFGLTPGHYPATLILLGLLCALGGAVGAFRWWRERWES
jgi:cobalt/nickel transport system permease protein